MPAVSLEQLIAINDEIAALVRARIPLELGLRQVTGDSHGQLRRISASLAGALNRGESLPAALESCGHDFPPVYRAVIEAGLRGQNLPRALEAVTSFAQSTLDLRRRMGLALVYPILVVLSAYGLFLLMLSRFEPQWVWFIEQQNPAPPSGVFTLLDFLRETMAWWWPILPALMLAFIVWWWWTGRRGALGAGWLQRLAFGPVSVSNFAELLSILVEQRVPLIEALPLAAAATGDARLINDCRTAVHQLERGSPLSTSLESARSIPPLMRWMLAGAEKTPNLDTALHQAAVTYRLRAVSRAEWIKLFVPVILVLVVGGGATLFYALTTFLPLREMMFQLLRE